MGVINYLNPHSNLTSLIYLWFEHSFTSLLVVPSYFTFYFISLFCSTLDPPVLDRQSFSLTVLLFFKMENCDDNPIFLLMLVFHCISSYKFLSDSNIKWWWKKRYHVVPYPYEYHTRAVHDRIGWYHSHRYIHRTIQLWNHCKRRGTWPNISTDKEGTVG
jgi:hypothetical protein